MKPVACWHHGCETRLFDHLKNNRIDLWGPGAVTVKGTNRLNYWWNLRMRLKVGDKIQIALKKEIVATATIATEPLPLPRRASSVAKRGIFEGYSAA